MNNLIRNRDLSGKKILINLLSHWVHFDKCNNKSCGWQYLPGISWLVNIFQAIGHKLDSTMLNNESYHLWPLNRHSWTVKHLWLYKLCILSYFTILRIYKVSVFNENLPDDTYIVEFLDGTNNVEWKSTHYSFALSFCVTGLYVTCAECYEVFLKTSVTEVIISGAWSSP